MEVKCSAFLFKLISYILNKLCKMHLPNSYPRQLGSKGCEVHSFSALFSIREAHVSAVLTQLAGEPSHKTNWNTMFKNNLQKGAGGTITWPTSSVEDIKRRSQHSLPSQRGADCCPPSWSQRHQSSDPQNSLTEGSGLTLYFFAKLPHSISHFSNFSSSDTKTCTGEVWKGNTSFPLAVMNCSVSCCEVVPRMVRRPGGPAQDRNQTALGTLP